MSTPGWKEENFDGVERIALAAAVDGLRDATEFLLEEANRTAPIEESTLTGSGTAAVNADRRRTRRPQGTVSYDTPYAARQHEELGWRHDPGRRAKWLELTMSEQARKIGEIIATKFSAAMK